MSAFYYLTYEMISSAIRRKIISDWIKGSEEYKALREEYHGLIDLIVGEAWSRVTEEERKYIETFGDSFIKVQAGLSINTLNFLLKNGFGREENLPYGILGTSYNSKELFRNSDLPESLADIIKLEVPKGTPYLCNYWGANEGLVWLNKNSEFKERLKERVVAYARLAISLHSKIQALGKVLTREDITIKAIKKYYKELLCEEA